MKVEKLQEKELMENQLWLVMIDRFLKEKYNEIEYLAIQPQHDPGIVEINKEDLEWLMTEHERAEQLDEMKMEYTKLCQSHDKLYQQYVEVLTSNTWKFGSHIGKVVHVLLTPFRWLRREK